MSTFQKLTNLGGEKQENSNMNIPFVTLNNGIKMPQLGLGLYAPKQQNEIKQSVLDALDLGIRLIDSAAIYGNEKEVGQGINESGIPRSELFITSKVWMDDMGYDSTLRAFDKTLKDLDVEYLLDSLAQG